MLSIIIPTLNEEKNLPLLLKSIRSQNFKEDYEIIIADAGSKDNTVKIAKKYGCKVVSGGLPAKGRNRGAKAAKGDLLLFLDADVVLPKNFLKKILTEFKKRKLDVAGATLNPQTQKKMIKFLFDFFYNIPIKKLERFLPFGAMGILAKKVIHQKIKGFDEKIKLCEDHDYVRRAAKIGKFGVLKSAKISVSLRRFYKEGWLKVILKYVFAEFYYHIFGPVKSDIFHYEFGHYKKYK